MVVSGILCAVRTWLPILQAAVATCAALAALGCRDGVRANPDDPRLIAAEAALVAGDIDLAGEALTPLVEEFPDTGRARLLMGMVLKEQHKYALAIPHLERAVELQPFERWESGWFLLGWCRYYEGDLPGAQVAFERHLELEPIHSDTYFGLGVVALDEGRLDDAEASFERAIALLEDEVTRRMQSGVPVDRHREDLAIAQYRRAEVLVAGERWAEAREALQLALNILPGLRQGWWLLHQVLLELGLDEDAAKVLERHEALGQGGGR